MNLRSDRRQNIQRELDFQHESVDGGSMEVFLKGVSRALKSSARFVIETGMVAEAILPNFKEREWFQIDDILLTIENRYRVELSCVEENYTFVRDGKVETRQSRALGLHCGGDTTNARTGGACGVRNVWIA